MQTYKYNTVLMSTTTKGPMRNIKNFTTPFELDLSNIKMQKESVEDQGTLSLEEQFLQVHLQPENYES